MPDATVSYELSEAEMIRGYEYFYRTSPTDRRLGLIARIGGPIVFAACIGFIERDQPDVLVRVGGALVVMALVLGIGGRYFNRMVWKSRFRKQKATGDGPTRLTLETDGIRSASNAGEGLLRWSAVERIDGERECVYFMIGSGVISVPSRAFSAPDGFHEFIRRAKELKQASSSASN